LLPLLRAAPSVLTSRRGSGQGASRSIDERLSLGPLLARVLW
jgi:hypothetical protein